MKKIFVFLISVFLLYTSIQAQTAEDQSIKEFNSDQVNKYSSNGEDKSKGLKLHFKYPKSWKSIEGDRPHVIRKFAQSDNYVLAIILVNKLEKELSQKDINEIFTIDGLKAIVPENGTYISCNPNLKIEALNAGSVEYTVSATRVDRKFYTHVLNYMFVYKSYIITVQFIVADKINEMKVSVDDRYKKICPLFRQMFNSVVIDNIWEK